MQQTATEAQSDQTLSDMEVCLKQMSIIKYLHVEKIAPTDTYGCLLNISGDQTVDVRTERQWVLHFNSSDSGLPPLVQIFL